MPILWDSDYRPRIDCKQFSLTGLMKDSAEKILGISVPSDTLSGEICTTDDTYTFVKIGASYNATPSSSKKNFSLTPPQSIDSTKDQYFCSDSVTLKHYGWQHNTDGTRNSLFRSTVQHVCAFYPSQIMRTQQKKSQDFSEADFYSLVGIINRTPKF